MKNFFKKLFCFCLVVTVLFTSVAIVSANVKIDTVNLKNQLVEKAPKVTITDEKEKDKFADEVSKEFQKVFEKYGYDQDKFDEFFTSKGYIKFDAKKASISGISSLFGNDAYASVAGNATMSTPSIYYNASTGRWTAVGGGYWQNCTWSNDRKSYLGVYSNGNMGGNDVIGLYFSNLKDASGIQSAITKQELYTRCYGGSTLLASTTRMNQSSENGAFFAFQDNTYNDTVRNMTNYNLDGFSVLLEFDSRFANVNGVASSGYEHTWNDTGAVGITLSNSGWTASLNGSSNYAWKGYSTDSGY